MQIEVLYQVGNGLLIINALWIVFSLFYANASQDEPQEECEGGEQEWIFLENPLSALDSIGLNARWLLLHKREKLVDQDLELIGIKSETYVSYMLEVHIIGV